MAGGALQGGVIASGCPGSFEVRMTARYMTTSPPAPSLARDRKNQAAPASSRLIAGLSRASGSIALPMRHSTTPQRGLGHSQHGTFPIAAATLASLQG